jgi:hypothetical protein
MAMASPWPPISHDQKQALAIRHPGQPPRRRRGTEGPGPMHASARAPAPMCATKPSSDRRESSGRPASVFPGSRRAAGAAAEARDPCTCPLALGRRWRDDGLSDHREAAVAPRIRHPGQLPRRRRGSGGPGPMHLPARTPAPTCATTPKCLAGACDARSREMLLREETAGRAHVSRQCVGQPKAQPAAHGGGAADYAPLIRLTPAPRHGAGRGGPGRPNRRRLRRHPAPSHAGPDLTGLPGSA